MGAYLARQLYNDDDEDAAQDVVDLSAVEDDSTNQATPPPTGRFRTLADAADPRSPGLTRTPIDVVCTPGGTPKTDEKTTSKVESKIATPSGKKSALETNLHKRMFSRQRGTPKKPSSIPTLIKPAFQEYRGARLPSDELDGEEGEELSDDEENRPPGDALAEEGGLGGSIPMPDVELRITEAKSPIETDDFLDSPIRHLQRLTLNDSDEIVAVK